MKKSIIALLLVLAVVSFGVFAADPVDAEFTVTTSVVDNLYMGVTSASIDTVESFKSTDYTAVSTHGVTAAGNQTGLTAYITSWSNNAKGYSVTMSATPMVNASAASANINYTVTANGKSFITGTTAAPVELFDTTAITGITGSSHAITLNVDDVTFAAAATGSYTGTVTFAFTSNS